MVANNREKTRREAERRSVERRENIFEFGSLEWRQVVQQEYLLWPKRDRRQIERRSLGRRTIVRRVKNSGRNNSFIKPKNLATLLTNEEKQMLNELTQSDRVN